jgi:hypothetical protein
LASTCLGRYADDLVLKDVAIGFPLCLKIQANATPHVRKCCGQHGRQEGLLQQLWKWYELGRQSIRPLKYVVTAKFFVFISFCMIYTF